MTYTIHYHSLVVQEDIPNLSSENKRRIRKAIQKKLCEYPETFGKPLRKSLKGARVLRVGDYRIAYRVRGNVVEIAAIFHRSASYKHIQHRLSP